MSARNISPALTIWVAAALGWGCCFSVRLAWADALFRANTAASVKRATEIDPGNSSYHAWLAEILEHDGRDPGAELELASKLNPSDSAMWIRRGLRAESEGDYAGAERLLLHAAADSGWSKEMTPLPPQAMNGSTVRLSVGMCVA